MSKPKSKVEAPQFEEPIDYNADLLTEDVEAPVLAGNIESNVPEAAPLYDFTNEPTKSLGKVAVNEQTERCPFCKSHLVVNSTANPFKNRLCQNCKKQFRAEPLKRSA